MKISGDKEILNLHLSWGEMGFFNQMLQDYIEIIEDRNDPENDTEKMERLSAIARSVRLALEAFEGENHSEWLREYSCKIEK